MNERRLIRRPATFAAVAAASIVVGWAAVATADDESEPAARTVETIRSDTSEPFPRTSDGLTYAPTFDPAAAPDVLPDLVVARGEQGHSGYLRTDQLLRHQTPASSPEEAVQRMNDLDIDEDGNIWFPVYAGDGTTQIDRMLQGTVTER